MQPIYKIAEDKTLIEAESKRGVALLEKGKHFLERANDNILQDRNKERAAMLQRVTEQAATKGPSPGMKLQQVIQNSFDSKLWDDFAEHCVECSACNFVCCTCHCFLLGDGKNKNGVNARTKLWDACLFKNFARVAGGGNPQSLRATRLRNRFDKKFNFFPKTLGCYACDGCGRCTEVGFRHLFRSSRITCNPLNLVVIMNEVGGWFCFPSYP